jgi:glutamate formiminotransferase/formiminotetrahydrofolate cyclodeaminase
MNRLIECVPNFSEGRDSSVIDALAEAVRSTAGVSLLSVEPDRDYHRTVITMVGSDTDVVDAAFKATAIAADRIDMRTHRGEHPRLGAVDVVPFIPIANASMDDCVALSRLYGKRVAKELGIPIYYYEYAATRKERRNLSDIRKGEYEGLAAKLADPAWAPDDGAAVFNERSGATVTGARKILIAYNVNLSTPDVNVAQEIALRIRESGRVKKDDQGNTVKDSAGNSVKIPGTLKAVKAMGVYLERYKIAQVSINLVDVEVTSMHDAFDEVARQAETLGVKATGSELVGLAPLGAFRKAAVRAGADASVSDLEAVHLATKYLGLDQLEPFVPTRKVIDLMI